MAIASIDTVRITLLQYIYIVYCNYKTRPIKNELPASRAGHGILPLVSLANTEDVADQS